MSKSIYTHYTHRHHIIPKHAGGSNDPSNIEVITGSTPQEVIKKHSIKHKILYFKEGRWQDRVAWQTLSGQIDKVEASRQAQSLANLGNTHGLGYKHTPEASKKISDAQKVNMIGNKRALGHKKMDECKKILSKKSMGNTNKLGKTGPQTNKWEGRSEYAKKNNPMFDPAVKEKHRLACLKREEKKRNARIQSTHHKNS